MTVRLYGRDIGNGSLVTVTRGFARALSAAGLLEGFVALDRSGGDEESDGPPGALARDGVFTGPLSLANNMRRNAQHERHWVTVTPNSTHIPRELLAEVVKLPNSRILSASAWGTGVIVETLREMEFRIHLSDTSELPWVQMRSGVVDVQLHTVRHGVSGFAPVPAELEKTRADFDRGMFRVVHFSTTAGQRKGTMELIQAWNLARKDLPPSAELLLVLDHHAREALVGRLMDHDVPISSTIKLLPRGDMRPGLMSHLLCSMHAVVCPSRGEGFSLGPLEARACGVPVVATDVTGQSAGHCEGPGVIRIKRSNEAAPIDDGPGAMAPVVRPGAIADALLTLAMDWPAISAQASLCAPDVADEWSWERQLAGFVELLR